MIDCRISWIFVKVCIRLLLGPVWRGGGGAVSTYDSVSSVTSASGPVVFALGQSCSPPWWGSQPRLVHLSALKWSLFARLSAYVTGKRYGAKHQFSLWERPALDYLPLEGRANLHVVGLLEPLEIRFPGRSRHQPALLLPNSEKVQTSSYWVTTQTRSRRMPLLERHLANQGLSSHPQTHGTPFRTVFGDLLTYLE